MLAEHEASGIPLPVPDDRERCKEKARRKTERRFFGGWGGLRGNPYDLFYQKLIPVYALIGQVLTVIVNNPVFLVLITKRDLTTRSFNEARTVKNCR